MRSADVFCEKSEILLFLQNLNRPAQDANHCIKTMYYLSSEGGALIITNTIGLRYSISFRNQEGYLEENGITSAAKSILAKRDSSELMSYFDLSVIIQEIQEQTGVFGTKPFCDPHNHRIWLGDKIRQRRKEMGVDESEIAEWLEISTKTMRKIEEGRYAADIDLLQRIAEALHCNLGLIAK